MKHHRFLLNQNWAQSRGGRAIALYGSGQNPTSTQRPILIVGGVHGDEPEGVWLSEHVLEWLSEFDYKIPWLLITCLNADGYDTNSRVNAAGVDLNRNFPCKSWTQDHTQPRYYPGPAAGSEPEVRALVKLIDETHPQLIIHCHSWHPCVVYTGLPGKKDSDRLGASSGYESRADIGYPTPGSLGEYGWFEKSIPVICIEEQEGEKKENVWPHFKAGFEQIMSDPLPRI